jgi:hypothetical protein
MQGAEWIGCERICAAPGPSTGDDICQNPLAALDGSWVQVESAQWHDCDIDADRTSTVALPGKRQSGGLIQALIVDAFFERERNIAYAQAMRKCLAAKTTRLAILGAASRGPIVNEEECVHCREFQQVPRNAQVNGRHSAGPGVRGIKARTRRARKFPSAHVCGGIRRPGLPGVKLVAEGNYPRRRTGRFSSLC